ncbi:MAG TPA: cation:proton antiporter, partial [Smithellaceae bacterium]|nr:cation:proton antiporter [Smithellaceae bacterium]
MTYYVLIAFCVIILLAYIFDITAKYTRVPGVILLIATGMFINYLSSSFHIGIPDMSGLLPIMGTLGLILIVLEGSLDLAIRRDKSRLIIGSVSSAILLFAVMIGVFTYVAVHFLQYDLRASLLNIIPFAVISSAVAIPSAAGLTPENREFVTYESSISDIIGILAFDFILLSSGSLGTGVLRFIAELILTFIVSVLLSGGLAILLHKISHHVKYVIIMTVIILVYALAKLVHLPSLLVVLIFGLVMNNNVLFKNAFSAKWINFDEFNTDLGAFKNIVFELTFIIRCFFFILFGFYTRLSDLLNPSNLIIAAAITVSIFIFRALFFRIVLRLPLNPLLYFAPRGLITILLFFSIPSILLLPFINVGIVTQVIFLTILMMTFGNMIFSRD